MAAFPTKGPEQIDALSKQAQAILSVFARDGYARYEPSVLQPADIFLDRSGEEGHAERVRRQRIEKSLVQSEHVRRVYVSGSASEQDGAFGRGFDVAAVEGL